MVEEWMSPISRTVSVCLTDVLVLFSQGAAVIHTPPFKNQDILFPVKVNIEIVNGNVKNGKCSEPIEFTYNPRKDLLNASVPHNGHNLGGILAGIPLSTSTLPPQTLGSSMANIAPPPPVTTVIPDASLLTSPISTPTPVPQPVKKQPDINGKNTNKLYQNCTLYRLLDTLTYTWYAKFNTDSPTRPTHPTVATHAKFRTSLIYRI